MKTIIITVLIGIALVFLASGCDSDITAVKETKDNTSLNIATVYLNNGKIETIQFTDMEYSVVLDNGYGFAFTKDGVFVKSYLTENIQTIIIQNE